MPNLATEIETVHWRGASGSDYKYWVYPIGTTFKEVPGNYIFTKRENGRWRPIYVGETENLGERFDTHHKAQCIARKSATHIRAHTSSERVEVRRAEESDIIKGNAECKEPSGCNG